MGHARRLGRHRQRAASVAEREVWEESGYRVQAEKVVAVLDANRIEPMEFYHAYKIIFLCKLLDGEPRTSHETLAVDFFDPESCLPCLSSAPMKPCCRKSSRMCRIHSARTMFD